MFIEIPKLKLQAKKGIFSGKDILATIRWFILRWSVISNNTIIISPFIDGDNWLFLEKIYKIQLDQLNTKSEINILTRRLQLRKGKWDNIEESLKEKLKELQIRCEKIRESDDNTPCFTGVGYCNHQILEKLLENTSFKAKYDDFHAKLYAGIIINKKSEVLFTSFNLLTSELKQKENFVLIEMDSNELSSQIRAFFKDSKKIKETSFPF